ncbi:MAG TPA: TPM domain-containing protein [Chitinophagaceae bacterium]|nr:TPM domain-containing protein [Chitinophagaceae bacterium]
MRFFFPLILIGTMFPFFCQSAVRDTLHIPDRPVPHRYVNDMAHVLNQDQRNSLEISLRTYARENHQVIAVTIMDSTGQNDLGDYSRAMIKKWQIGYSDDEKGVLILVDMHTKKVFIGVGDGLQSQLDPTVNLNMVKKDVIPAFGKSDYYTGLRKAINGIEISLIPASVIKNYVDNRKSATKYFLIAGLVLVLAIAGYFIFFPRGQTPAK